jgi:O-antigen/teichoic acid export membrane protein
MTMISSESGSMDAHEKGADHDAHALTIRLLKRGASGAFLVQVGGAGLGLVTHLLLARLLGSSEYGVYSLSLTWISVLAVLAILGQDSSVVRFIPRYIHHGQWGQLRGLRRGVHLMVLASSGAVTLLMALSIHLFRARLHASLAHTLWVACLLLPVLTQLHLSGALHRGLKRAVSFGVFNSVLRPLLVLALVTGLVVGLGFRLTAPWAMGISICAVLGAWILSELTLGRAWPRQARRATAVFETRAWMTLGRHLFLLSAISIVLGRVDVMILGGMMGAQRVGPYFAAVQLANLAAYGLNAVNTILAPMIAEKHVAKDHSGLRMLVRRAAWLTFAVTCVIALGTAGFGRWLLSLFGAGFVVAYVPLLIVLAGQFVNASMGPVGYLMTMTRHERPAALFSGASACINVLLSLLLIPKLGLTGAAIAAATSMIAWNVSALIFVRRKLAINPTVFPLATEEMS